MPIRINFCKIVLSNCFSLLKLLFVKLPGSLENSQHLQLGLSFQSVSALNIKILISYFFQLQFALKITAFLLRTFHNYRLARLKQGTAASALLCTSENKAGRDPALFCVCTHFTVNYMQTQLIASKYPTYILYNIQTWEQKIGQIHQNSTHHEVEVPILYYRVQNWSQWLSRIQTRLLTKRLDPTIYT